MKNEASRSKWSTLKLSILSLRKNVNDAHILVYVSMYNVMVRYHLLRYVSSGSTC